VLYISYYYYSQERSPPVILNEKYITYDKKTKLTAVLYEYYESGYLANRNLEYFVNVGLSTRNSTIDYFFIVNGRLCTPCDSMPEYDNIFFIHRPEKGIDYGSWGEILRLILNRRSYEYYVLMNPISRGPFYVPGSFQLHKHHWIEYFTRLLVEETHLVGPTISCQKKPHVQSYFMVATSTAMNLALQNNIFEARDWEIEFSQLLLNKGMNIACLMVRYAFVDFRKGPPRDCGDFNPVVGVMMNNSLEKLNPFEVLFYPGYRLTDNVIEEYSLVLENEVKKKYEF